jgi:hypothetical protein
MKLPWLAPAQARAAEGVVAAERAVDALRRKPKLTVATELHFIPGVQPPVLACLTNKPTRQPYKSSTVYGKLKVLIRKTAICTRVAGLSGQ